MNHEKSQQKLAVCVVAGLDSLASRLRGFSLRNNPLGRFAATLTLAATGGALSAYRRSRTNDLRVMDPTSCRLA